MPFTYTALYRWSLDLEVSIELTQSNHILLYSQIYSTIIFFIRLYFSYIWDSNTLIKETGRHNAKSTCLIHRNYIMESNSILWQTPRVCSHMLYCCVKTKYLPCLLFPTFNPTPCFSKRNYIQSTFPRERFQKPRYYKSQNTSSFTPS